MICRLGALHARGYAQRTLRAIYIHKKCGGPKNPKKQKPRGERGLRPVLWRGDHFGEAGLVLAANKVWSCTACSQLGKIKGAPTEADDRDSTEFVCSFMGWR